MDTQVETRQRPQNSGPHVTSSYKKSTKLSASSWKGDASRRHWNTEHDQCGRRYFHECL